MGTQIRTQVRLIRTDGATATFGVSEPLLRAVAAAASVWAGISHFAASGGHYEDSRLVGVGFIAAAVLQLAWAVIVLFRPSLPVYWAGMAINSTLLGSLIWFRAYGPFHASEGQIPLEVLAILLEALVILALLKLAPSPSPRPIRLMHPAVQRGFGIVGVIVVPFLVFMLATGWGPRPEVETEIATASQHHAAEAPDTLPPVTESSKEPATHTVVALDNLFEPLRLTIAPGDTVEWVMEGKLPHTVSSDTGDFESGNLDPGQTFKQTFPEEGVYFYYCKLHGSPQSGMWGSIRVADGGKVPVHSAPQLASTSSGSTEPATFRVASGDNFFSPQELNVAVGDTIEWANTGGAIHNATSDTGAFSSGDLTPGSSWSQTFTQVGTYFYFCTYHGSVGSGMWGVVTVAPPGEVPVTAPSPPPDGDKPPPDEPGVGTVGMTLDKFDPVRAKAQTGDRVRWFNNSTVPHTVTFEDGRKGSGLIDPDLTFRSKFAEAGRYYYWCELHGSPRDGMWGVVIVKGDGNGQPPPEPPPPPDPPPPIGDAAVAVFDSRFDPEELHVKLGDTVVWSNDGKLAHTVTSEGDIFDSGHMPAGDWFSFTFEQEGTFSYICEYHLEAGMKGVVIVEGAPEGAAEVSAGDDVFEPPDLTVSAGDTVTWTNNGEHPHTVTSSVESAPFDSGNLAPGEDFSNTFTEPGTYTYYCSYHSDPVTGTGMVGTVVVEEPAPPTRAGAFAATFILLALSLWSRLRAESSAFRRRTKRSRPKGKWGS